MPVAAARTLTLTPEESFDWEERHEHARGHVYPTPGGTPEHFLIIGNWVRLLGNALLDRDALVYPDGMRLQVNDERYVYPDVSVVLGEPAFRDAKRRVLLNPSVAVEVLSEKRQVGEASTASYDQGEKFALYRQVPSLQEIVWVDSERRWAEVAVKTGGAWTLPAPVADGSIALPSLAVEVSLDDLYHGVDLA